MGKGKGHIPLRTCIGCGAKKKKQDLIRLVLNDEGEVIRDHTGHAPGRGAYVCDSEACGRHPKMAMSLKRALRTEGSSIRISKQRHANFRAFDRVIDWPEG